MAYKNSVYIHSGDWLKITRPDGSIIRLRVSSNNTDNVSFVDGVKESDKITVDMVDSYNAKHTLDWHNCFSFGNGVESNKIRDNFNTQSIKPGVKVSTVFEDYKQERRKYGLIYSGIYNGISSTNNLNQFIQGEKITKDINPIYGSIQKLHTRDSDLVTLCEDKVLRIQANKDALYNADGNMQLTATNNVLGQAIPFVGEFGISTNPESFASENYRVYFADKIRGVIVRLSKDGLTPISDHGMKDWFRDNLKITNTIVGSYDDRNDEYNVTLKDRTINQRLDPTTVSFKEDVKGWVSFKSFTPENALSCANNYFTLNDGKLYEHYVETEPRNTFYSAYEESWVDVLLNDMPSSIKSYHTLEYEGSQSKVDMFKTDTNTGIADDEIYNLTGKNGWYVESIITNEKTGSLNEFIEKEGKWFNYIKGVDTAVDAETDFGTSSIQGIGVLESVDGNVMEFVDYINMSLQVGDTVYFQTPTTNGNFTTISPGSISEFGVVSSTTDYTLTVVTAANTPSQGDYVLFSKNNIINTSSLPGYYARVKLKNNSTTEAELFAVSSEVTESSK